jgi:hypothetical protein
MTRRPPSLRLPALAAGLAGCALLGFPANGRAQSGHYWGNQFGNESLLLNGAVIGSVTDLGAVFYNPARLLNMTSPAFVVSAKLYEWVSFSAEDALGNGRDLDQSSFGGAPGFVGGTFTVPFLEGHQFGYGFLTRNRGTLEYFIRDEASGDVVESLPGEDEFVGFVDVAAKLNDDWVGLSWAYPLSERWSVGASAFYFNRSRSSSVKLDLRAVNEFDDAATYNIERAYRVSDQGLLAKTGLSWVGDRTSFGLTLTTPYWSILQSGVIRYEDFAVNVDVDGDGAPENVLTSSVQRDLPMEWKTPWSMGLGVGHARGNWLFHGSTEYFSSLDRHTVLRADSVPSQSTGEPLDFAIVEERIAVLNAGLGVRYQRSDRLSAFGSVATNFSSAPDSVVRLAEVEPETNITTMGMDFILLGAGVSFSTKWADLTIGATWQAGDEPAQRILNLPGEDEDVTLPEEQGSTLKIDQWRFLFGFSFPFGEQLGETLTGG